jgi:hypothetical protein
MLARIEDLEARRSGRPVLKVRGTVAQRLHAGAGTLANIRKQRRKTIPAWLMKNLGEHLVETLQSEIRALEHEIATARQIGLDHRDDASPAPAVRPMILGV